MISDVETAVPLPMVAKVSATSGRDRRWRSTARVFSSVCRKTAPGPRSMSTTSLLWSKEGMNSLWIAFRGRRARLPSEQDRDRDDDLPPVRQAPEEEPSISVLDGPIEKPAKGPGLLRVRSLVRLSDALSNMRDAIIGVTVKDTSRERSVAETTVIPNCRKNCPTISCRKAMGPKTTTSQSVMATAARPISIRPRTAAVRGSSPRWMWRSTFSRITMESSTRIPMHSPRPMSVTIFSVKWKAYIAKKVPTSEMGIAISTIREDLQRRRKRKRTREVVMMLSTRFSRVSSSDELMKVVASLATASDVPGSIVCWRSERAALTRPAVSTTFASLCLRTKIPMDGRESIRTTWVDSG